MTSGNDTNYLGGFVARVSTEHILGGLRWRAGILEQLVEVHHYDNGDLVEAERLWRAVPTVEEPTS